MEMRLSPRPNSKSREESNDSPDWPVLWFFHAAVRSVIARRPPIIAELSLITLKSNSTLTAVQVSAR